MAFSASYLPVRTPKTIIFSQHRKPHCLHDEILTTTPSTRRLARSSSCSRPVPTNDDLRFRRLRHWRLRPTDTVTRWPPRVSHTEAWTCYRRGMRWLKYYVYRLRGV